VKGPGPSIKEDTWGAVKVNPKKFSQGVVFHHFRTPEVEGPRTICSRNHEIVNSKILKSGLWSQVDFDISGSKSLKDLESLRP
jgi:hypothetical protein